MNLRRILPASILMLGAWALPVGAARADSIIYDGISLISGQQAFTESFNLTSSGALTMNLTSIPWLDTVSGLSGFLSTSAGQISDSLITGPGTSTVDLGPGTYYAHWFGDASGQYNLGVVGLKIDFASNGTPVGLPTSLVLMLSGLGLLFGWQGRRAPAAAAPDMVSC